MARPTNDRIIGVLLTGLGLLGTLWVRCVWLQAVAARRYATIASQQHHATQRLLAQRGTIADRTGRPLAISAPAPSVFANARAVSAKRELARRLANIVDRDAGMIERRLERDKGFVWVARQVDLSVPPALAPLGEAGIGIVEEPKRVYPHGPLAGHVLGFVDIDARGLEQLELAFDGLLRGQDGWRSTLRDAKGDLLVGPWTTQVEPVAGYDLVLTLDSVVQQVAEDVLVRGVRKYRAKGGSVIILEAATGAVLALANVPSYDPNDPGAAPPEHRRNRAVTDLFEPGSIFKIVTASALLQEGRIAPEDRIFCENGSYPTVGRHILHDHRPHGVLSFHEVVQYSSNIGTAKAAQRLTPEELYRYIRAFGFGERTGIELPGEVAGLLRPPAQWSRLSPFIIPIGQEVAATPLQLAVMTAAIANGGLRVRPYIVERVQTSEGRVVRAHEVVSPTRILSSETAARVQEMLVSVVRSGTGGFAKVPGLSVGGKTGTAQKLEPDGRYSHSRFLASFVGFVPAPDARFVIVVLIDEPRPLYFGGVVAAPLFRQIVERLAAYWECERAPAGAGTTQASGMRRGVVAQLPSRDRIGFQAGLENEVAR